MGDLPEGGAADSTSFQPEIPPENWVSAENAAREIIRKVQPTSVSEERRRNVVDYIQKLIRTCLGAEVFPYGSVPLKTYLPDGDIDLTAFGGANIEDILADEMKSILEKEEKNMSAEFVVKDVQLIRAEVKLVKVIVQNIVVDVSFNQIGGLSTLCFLEQVDRLIGKDHLFKYSIILIKAWCYYESRILGAHHGLISTYALETLVLYIFHRFHSSLDGPLAVLYKFLDYFSKFDWDKYSISLNGPVRLSSFPAIVPEMPEDCGDLLLSSDFLNSCVGKFSVPSRSGDKSSRGFQLKHLNIVDPLKETNNLGRSVSKGNFYRIRSAFSYGARKLGHMLLQPEDSIANELHKFFSNTTARHGGAESPDVHKIDKLYEHHDEYAVANGVFRSGINKLPHDLLKGPERAFDADLATSVLGGLAISTDSSKSPTPMLNESANAIPKPIFIPHHFFANAKLANGSMSNGVGGTLVDKNEKVDPTKPKDFSGEQNQIYSNHGSASMSETPEALNSLSDLTGDYESYLQCLQYGRVFYDYALDVQPLHLTPSPYQKNNSWDSLLPMSSFKQNGFSHRHHNGFNPNPAMFAMHHALMPGVPFGWEDVSKPRGTGTYFPNLVQNQSPQGYRSSAMKGRNHAPSSSPHNNERNMTFLDQNMLDNRNVMIGSSESHPSFSPRGNSLIIQPEGVVEFEVEKSRQPKPVSSSPKTFSAMKKSKPALSKEQDRISLRSSYRLKDEDDFPPLSV